MKISRNSACSTDRVALLTSGTGEAEPPSAWELEYQAQKLGSAHLALSKFICLVGYAVANPPYIRFCQSVSTDLSFSLALECKALFSQIQVNLLYDITIN